MPSKKATDTSTKRRKSTKRLATIDDIYKKYHNRKVDVMGVTYIIYLRSANKDKELKNTNASGYIFLPGRYIVVNYDKLKMKAEDNIKDCLVCLYSTLRHEIVHAFLGESGLDWDSLTVDTPWAVNEEMVDWISLQLEKIHKVYVELGITGE